MVNPGDLAGNTEEGELSISSCRLSNFVILLFCLQKVTENLDKHKDLIGKANKDLEELRVQKDALQNERK